MDKERQRELRQNYKEMKLDAGVYQIRNKTSGRILIGSAFNVNGKLNGVKFELELGSFRNTRLQKDWKEIGEDGFEISILETLDQDKIEKILQKDELAKLEKKWLEKLSQSGAELYN